MPRPRQKREKRYGTVDVRTWADPQFRSLSAITPSAQGLWLYLLTGPHRTPIPGLFRMGIAQLAEELTWDTKDVQRCWAEIEEIGWGRADWKARLVWLPVRLEQDPPDNPSVVAGWKMWWDELPDCALLAEAWTAFSDHMRSRDGQSAKSGYLAALHRFRAPAHSHRGHGAGHGVPHGGGHKEPESEPDSEPDSESQREKEAPLPSRPGAPPLHLSSESLEGLQPQSATDSPADKARRVFEHWRAVMEKSGTVKFAGKRERAVRARLKDGYTVDELIAAVDGCAATDWNMGRDPKTAGKSFNDLALICRDGSNVERFRDTPRAAKADTRQQAPSLAFPETEAGRAWQRTWDALPSSCYGREYLAKLQPLGVAMGVLSLGCPDDGFRQWIQRNYAEIVGAAWRQAGGASVAFVLSGQVEAA